MPWVLTAVGAWIGALVARPVSGVMLAAVAGAALARPVLRPPAVAVVVSALAASAWAGLSPPDPGPVRGPMVVVDIPRRVGAATTAVVRSGDRRLEVWAHGAAGGSLATAAPGSTVAVSGSVGPVPPGGRRWAAARHVAGRIDADHVEVVAGPAGPWRVGERLASLLSRGTTDLDPVTRSLVLGVTIGDDRGRPDGLDAAFRGAGLSHLLVVSGQNVALVVAAATPVLTRRGPVAATLGTLAVIAVFTLVTRAEPSVLRAATMAALATVTALVDRRPAGAALLGVAVTVLVAVDPLLVHHPAFQLSVAATAGIVTLSGWLERHLPGPRALRAVVATTVAAQIPVTAVLWSLGATVPPVTVPANVVAAPLVAGLTVWGGMASLVAGVAGPVAPLVHLPTRVLALALAQVATTGAAAGPVPVVGAHVILLGGAVAWDRLSRPGPPRVPSGPGHPQRG